MIVYSTPSCPRCELLKQKLRENNIPFDVCMDVDEMTSKGIKTVPIVEFDDGTRIGFADAIKNVGSFANVH